MLVLSYRFCTVLWLSPDALRKVSTDALYGLQLTTAPGKIWAVCRTISNCGNAWVMVHHSIGIPSCIDIHTLGSPRVSWRIGLSRGGLKVFEMSRAAATEARAPPPTRTLVTDKAMLCVT